MNKDELYKLLKGNMSIKTSYDWCGSQKILTINIFFDGKQIATAKETLKWDDDDF